MHDMGILVLITQHELNRRHLAFYAVKGQHTVDMLVMIARWIRKADDIAYRKGSRKIKINVKWHDKAS